MSKARDLVTDNCNQQCTYWREKLTLAGEGQLEAWVQEGVPLEDIVQRLKTVFSFEASVRSLARHISKHMHEPSDDVLVQGMTDLQVLEEMIKVGAKNLRADAKVRISPEMTVRAIELKYKLTQGNVFEDFLSAMGKTMEVEVGRGDDPSIQSDDEAAQAKEE